jgi:predicted RND superfamily exporter protein
MLLPRLKELALTQTAPPFAIAQILASIGFVAFGVRSVRRFRPDGVSPSVPPAHAGPSAVTP